MADRTAAMSHDDDNDDDKRKMSEKPTADAAATVASTTSASVGLSSQARNDSAVQPGLSSDPSLNQAASPGSNNLPARRQPGVSSHNRQVSWDQQLVVDDSHPPTTYSPTIGSYSPVLEGILQEGILPPIPEDLLQPSLTAGAGAASTSFRSLHLNLEDVVQQTPYEAEAETYILKVLEQRDPTYSPSSSNRFSRYNGNNDTNTYSSTASILNNVPEDVAHNFSLEEDYTPDNDYDDDGVAKEHTSVRSDNQSEISATTSQLSPSRNSRQQRLAGRTSHIWDTNHRANRSVEETLFGLTSALQEMNTLADTPQNPATAWDAAGKEYNNITNMTTHHRRTGSSAEQLAVNASLLFQRKKNDAPTPDDDISVVSGGDASDIDGSIGNKSSLESVQVPASPNAGGRWSALITAVGGGRKRSDSDAHGSTSSGDRISRKRSDSDAYGSVSTPALEEDIPEGDEEEGGLTDDKPDEESFNKKPPEETRREPRKTFAAHIKEELDYVSKFRNATRNPLAQAIHVYCKVVLLYLILPSTGIAAILFHLADNPPNGYDMQGTTSSAAVRSSSASASWWLLFLGVRQVITLSLAMGTELFVIDFLSIRVRGTLRLVGPVLCRPHPLNEIFLTSFVTLSFSLMNEVDHPHDYTIQGVAVLGLCVGHEKLEMFTEKNPAGHVVSSDTYRRILTVAVSVGIVVAIKRFWLALFLGKQTFAQYAEKLAGVMRKILLITQVASTSRDFERYARSHLHSEMKKPPPMSYYGADVLANFVKEAEGDEDSQFTQSIQGPQSTTSQATSRAPVEDYLINTDDRDPLTGSLSSLQRSKIIQILGRWEEPEISESRQQPISVGALLQFRRALASINTPFPFSGAFGTADTRENTIQSSQEVYRRLQLRSPDEEKLKFETIALIAVRRDGTLDETKLKDLVRLFRPNRDGSLSMIDFVKSIDSVYKSLRLLRASVANSSKIDRSFENIFNIAFYAVVTCVILSQLGFDPLALFLSISGVILAFAFMIGSASSKYFEGLLFILVRRPFSIGDGIHASNVESETSFHGSPPWIVEDVNLFTTTVVNAWTNERATLSNGSLANSRIINAARSPQAYLYVYLKFGVDVPLSRLEIFRSALEQFIRDRPREWLSLCAFRATTVEANLGYIEYIIVLQHRESWQAVTPLYMSKASLSSFCHELSKQLDMRYQSPPLPVDLSISQRDRPVEGASAVDGLRSAPPDFQDQLSLVAAMFAKKR